MIDFRKLIYRSLTQRQEILDWVATLDNGLPNISTNVTTNAIFPMIVLTEINTLDAVSSGNNIVDVYETFWEISLFNRVKGFSKIKKIIDEEMHGLGFSLYGTFEDVNQDTKITEISLKYKQTISQETFNTLEKNINIWR